MNSLDRYVPVFVRIVKIYFDEVNKGANYKESEARANVFLYLDSLYKPAGTTNLGTTPIDLLTIIDFGFVKNRREIYVLDSGRYDSEDVIILKLRKIVQDWIEGKVRELRLRSRLDSQRRVEQVTKVEKKKDISTAQYLLIEYFTQGELKEQPNPYVDKTVKHRELSEKYPKSAEDFKKAFKRLIPILENRTRMTAEKKKYYRKELTGVLNYFNQMGKFDLAGKVQNELDSPKFNPIL